MLLAEWRALPLRVGHPAGKFFGHGFLLLLPAPRQRGGGPRSCAVGGARASTIVLDDNEASRQTPPPPPFGWSPSPAIAGADARSRSRDAPWHPRFASRFKKARPICHPIFAHDLFRKPQLHFSGSCEKNGAERRKARTSFAVPSGARHAPRRRMLPFVRASGALAFRRSTAALAAPDASGHRLSAQSRAS